MVPVIWSKEALRNLIGIKEYVSANSIYYAERLTKQLYHSVKRLESHPESGKIVQTQNNIILRRLIVKSYRIIYTYYKEKVYIIAIFHQARQMVAPLGIDGLFE